MCQKRHRLLLRMERRLRVVRGSWAPLVIDTIIKEGIYEFKTSFGAAVKYQAQQFAQYAKTAGYPIEYVFLHKPTAAEVRQLSNWIKEIGPEIRLQVSYILD